MDVADLRDKVAEAKTQLAAAIADGKIARRARVAGHKHSLDLLETQRREQVRKVQAESGLYWCNYDDVIAAYETARRRVLREGRELHFRHWDGNGKVTVRYQQGLPVSKSLWHGPAAANRPGERAGVVQPATQ